MRRLSWQKKLVQRSFSKEVKKAREDQNIEKQEELSRDCQFEIEFIEEEKELLFSNRLIDKAKRLRVPLPTHTRPEYWVDGRNFGSRYLSPDGISKLRDDIRKEERWRLEVRASRVVWLSAITGILGALTGLVAVWLKRQ